MIYLTYDPYANNFIVLDYVCKGVNLIVSGLLNKKKDGLNKVTRRA